MQTAIRAFLPGFTEYGEKRCETLLGLCHTDTTRVPLPLPPTITPTTAEPLSVSGTK